MRMNYGMSSRQKLVLLLVVVMVATTASATFVPVTGFALYLPWPALRF